MGWVVCSRFSDGWMWYVGIASEGKYRGWEGGMDAGRGKRMDVCADYREVGILWWLGEWVSERVTR